MDDVCSVYNYADDNTRLNTDHRIDSLVAKPENSAMVATHWFDINGMKSNQSKLQAMILNKHPDQNNISLNVNGTNVPLKSCVKLLGVFIDYELTFSEHVNYICKRTSRQLNAIRRISDGDRYASPTPDDGIKNTKLKVWRHEQLRACVRCIFHKIQK